MAKLTEQQRIIRLLRRIDYSRGPNRCWTWTGSHTAGYATVNWYGRSTGVHRLLWQLIFGAVPKTLVLDHLCMNPGCVNPLHLEPVTNEENLRRAGIAYGTRSADPTVCVRGHSKTSVHIDPAGREVCRACRRENAMKYHRRNYVHQGNANARKTQCIHGHDYTPENTYLQRNGNRSCKTCRKAASVEFYERKKHERGG